MLLCVSLLITDLTCSLVYKNKSRGLHIFLNADKAMRNLALSFTIVIIISLVKNKGYIIGA